MQSRRSVEREEAQGQPPVSFSIEGIGAPATVQAAGDLSHLSVQERQELQRITTQNLHDAYLLEVSPHDAYLESGEAPEAGPLLSALRYASEGERVAFLQGDLPFIIVNVDPSDTDAYGGITRLQEMEAEIAEAGLMPVIHIETIEGSRNSFRIVNNYAMPYTDEERQRLASILQAAESMDLETQMHIYSMYLSFREGTFRMKRAELNAALYADDMPQAVQVFRQIASLYRTTLPTVLSEMETIAWAPPMQAEVNMELLSSNIDRIGRLEERAISILTEFFSDYDPASIYLDSVITTSAEEQNLFEEIRQEYYSSRTFINMHARGVAMALLGFEVKLSSDEWPHYKYSPQMVLAELASLTGAVKAFTWKNRLTRFQDAAADFYARRVPEVLAEQHVGPDAGATDARRSPEYEDAGTRGVSGPLFYEQTLTEEERRELEDIRYDATAWATFIQRGVLDSAQVSTLLAGTEHFGVLRDFRTDSQQRISGISEVSSQLIDRLVDLDSYFLGQLREFQSVCSEQATEDYLWDAAREARGWDNVPAFLRIFLHEYGTPFIIGAIIAGAAIGGPAGGIRAGRAAAAAGEAVTVEAITGGVISGMASGAGTGFRLMSSIDAAAGAVLGADALVRFFRGDTSQMTMDDLAIAATYLSYRIALNPASTASARLISSAASAEVMLASGARVYDDIRTGKVMDAAIDLAFVAFGGYGLFRGIRGYIPVTLATGAQTAVAVTSTGIRSAEVPLVMRMVQVPFTMRGTLVNFGLAAGFSTIFGGDELVNICAREGLEGVSRYLSDLSVEFARGIAAFDFYIFGAGGVMKALRISTSQPARIDLLIRTGTFEKVQELLPSAVDISTEAGQRRLIELVFGEQALSRTPAQIAEYLGLGTDQAAIRAATRIRDEIRAGWDIALTQYSRAMRFGGESAASVRRAQEAIRDAVQEGTSVRSRFMRRLARAGRTGITIAGLGAVTYQSMSIYERAQQLRERNELLSAINPNEEVFLSSLLADGFPGVSLSMIDADSLMGAFRLAKQMDAYITGHNYEALDLDVECGYWLCAYALSRFPDQRDRLRFLIAVALSCAANGYSDFYTVSQSAMDALDSLGRFTAPTSGFGIPEYFLLSLGIWEAGGLDAYNGMMARVDSYVRYGSPGGYAPQNADLTSPAYSRLMDGVPSVTENANYPRFLVYAMHIGQLANMRVGVPDEEWMALATTTLLDTMQSAYFNDREAASCMFLFRELDWDYLYGIYSEDTIRGELGRIIDMLKPFGYGFEAGADLRRQQDEERRRGEGQTFFPPEMIEGILSTGEGY